MCTKIRPLDCLFHAFSYNILYHKRPKPAPVFLEILCPSLFCSLPPSLELLRSLPAAISERSELGDPALRRATRAVGLISALGTVGTVTSTRRTRGPQPGTAWVAQRAPRRSSVATSEWYMRGWLALTQLSTSTAVENSHRSRQPPPARASSLRSVGASSPIGAAGDCL